MSTAAGGGKAPGGAQPTEAHAERAQVRAVCVAPPFAGRRPGLTQLTPLVTACLQERSGVAAQHEQDTAATAAAAAHGAAGGEAAGAQLRQPAAAAAGAKLPKTFVVGNLRSASRAADGPTPERAAASCAAAPR